MPWLFVVVLAVIVGMALAVRFVERAVPPPLAVESASAYVDGSGAIRFEGPAPALPPIVRPDSDTIDLSWLIEAIRIAESGREAKARNRPQARDDGDGEDASVAGVPAWMLDDELFMLAAAGLSSMPAPEILAAVDWLRTADGSEGEIDAGAEADPAPPPE